MDEKKISIIVPVLNEIEVIDASITHLLSLNVHEIIFVDGGSEDGTAEQIKLNYPSIQLLQVEHSNRADQMNVGSSVATGDIILFSHVDMQFPPNAASLIRAALSGRARYGGFMKSYESGSITLSLYSFLLNHIYLGFMHKLVGTNGIFIDPELFKEMGGFPKQDFLEDVALSDKLRLSNQGVSIISECVRVSPRRYLKRGVIKQIIKNAQVLSAKKRGKSIVELRRLYEEND